MPNILEKYIYSMGGLISLFSWMYLIFVALIQLITRTILFLPPIPGVYSTLNSNFLWTGGDSLSPSFGGNGMMMYDPEAVDMPKSCSFPNRWHGAWTQSMFSQNLLINHNEIIDKGICLAQIKQRYLLYNEKRNCYQCLFITEKHYNVLQFKESYCGPKDTLQAICEQIGGDAFLYTLFRSNPSYISCPFPAERYQFQYSGEYGDCKNGQNQRESRSTGHPLTSKSLRKGGSLRFTTDRIDRKITTSNSFSEDLSLRNSNYMDKCTNPSQLLFRFQSCTTSVPSSLNKQEQKSSLRNSRSPSNNKILNFKLSCLAEWKDGNKNYLAGIVDFWDKRGSNLKNSQTLNHKSPFPESGGGEARNEEENVPAFDKYRCFIYEKKQGDGGYHLSMSYDSTCFGIFSAKDGPHLFDIDKEIIHEEDKQCSFPSYLNTHSRWPLLDRSGYIVPNDFEQSNLKVNNPLRAGYSSNFLEAKRAKLQKLVTESKTLLLYHKNINSEYPIEKMSCYEDLNIHRHATTGSSEERQSKSKTLWNLPLKDVTNTRPTLNSKEDHKGLNLGGDGRIVEQYHNLAFPSLLNNTGNLLAVINPQVSADSRTQPNLQRYVVHSVFGCFHGYKCLHLHRRSNHIVELQEGILAPSPELACRKTYFDPSRKSSIRFTTLAAETTPSHSDICPFNGLYHIVTSSSSIALNDPRGIHKFDHHMNALTRDRLNKQRVLLLRGVNQIRSPSSDRIRRDGTNNCLNNKFSLIEVGCKNPAVINIQHVCARRRDLKTTSSFRCHAHWQENGLHYLVSSEYHSKYLNCFIIKENRETSTLYISNTRGICKRNVNPEVDGIMRYHAISQDKCPPPPVYYNSFDDNKHYSSSMASTYRYSLSGKSSKTLYLIVFYVSLITFSLNFVYSLPINLLL